MFIPFYNHPLFEKDKRKILRQRWSDSTNSQNAVCYNKVVDLIKQGAPQDFLNAPFYRHELPLLENDSDLRGFRFWKIECDFANGENNFKGIDFTYSEFWHCHFKNAIFYQSSMDFVSCFNCTFDNCFFAFTSFLGAKIEKCKFIECDFPEACSFENVESINSTLDKCFFGETTPFRDCKFDDMTHILDQRHQSYFYKTTTTPKQALAGYCAAFQLAYEESGAVELASKYYWEGRRAFTRHNANCSGKVVGMVNELLTGYGVKPFRPIIAMLVLYVIATCLCSCVMPLKESIVFAAGALLTFGAGAEHLQDLGCWARIAYVCLAFFGIVLSGLFITIMANWWFRQKIPMRTIKPR